MQTFVDEHGNTYAVEYVDENGNLVDPADIDPSLDQVDMQDIENEIDMEEEDEEEIEVEVDENGNVVGEIMYGMRISRAEDGSYTVEPVRSSSSGSGVDEDDDRLDLLSIGSSSEEDTVTDSLDRPLMVKG